MITCCDLVYKRQIL